MIKTYDKLQAALKQQPAVEEFLDGSIKISYGQNTLREIVSGICIQKLDFPSPAIDLAFLRDLPAPAAPQPEAEYGEGSRTGTRATAARCCAGFTKAVWDICTEPA